MLFFTIVYKQIFLSSMNYNLPCFSIPTKAASAHLGGSRFTLTSFTSNPGNPPPFHQKILSLTEPRKQHKNNSFSAEKDRAYNFNLHLKDMRSIFMITRSDRRKKTQQKIIHCVLNKTCVLIRGLIVGLSPCIAGNLGSPLYSCQRKDPSHQVKSIFGHCRLSIISDCTIV